MSKKPQDLSWQEEYIREYRRTTGLAMSFGPLLPGGLYEVTCESTVPPSPTVHRMRRSEAMANTQRLRERPDHAAETLHG